MNAFIFAISAVIGFVVVDSLFALDEDLADMWVELGLEPWS
jgi:hypothetical protein